MYGRKMFFGLKFNSNVLKEEGMKKIFGLLATGLLLAAPAMAQEVPQQTVAPTYNCDFDPSCEVAPGIYGKMSSPAQSKFNLSIGGFVKADYTYNSSAVGPYYPAGPLPQGGTEKNLKDQSILTARQSRFWLKTTGPTLLGAKTSALIEGDFYGPTTFSNEFGNFRMRLAYGTLDWPNTQIIFGQFWDMFSPAPANTLDFRQGGPAGAPANPRVPQFRVTQKFNLNPDNYIRLAVAVQNPSQNNPNDTAGNLPDTGVNNDSSLGSVGTYGPMPAVGAHLMFVSKALGVAPGFWGLPMNSLQIGAFGLYGSQKIRGNHNVDTYGYGVYGFIPVLASKDGKNRAMTMSLETQAYISAGLTVDSANSKAFIGTAPTVNAAQVVTANGNLTAAKGYGFLGQAVFYPTQSLGFTAGYGRRNAYNYATYSAGDELYQDLLFANVAYDLNAAVRIAGEYEHGSSHFKGISAAQAAAGANSDSGQINTVRMSMIYFF
jgi:hypothetical protein